MGTFYEVNGSMKVSDTPKSRELLYELQDIVGEIECEVEDKEGMFIVDIHGGTFCSWCSASEIDDALKAFDLYVLEVAKFTTSADDNITDLLVGDDADVNKSIRSNYVQEARFAIRKLTKEEWQALCKEDFWS